MKYYAEKNAYQITEEELRKIKNDCEEQGARYAICWIVEKSMREFSPFTPFSKRVNIASRMYSDYCEDMGIGE